MPEVEPAQDAIDDTADDAGDAALERAKRALERLEAALSIDHDERIAPTNSAAENVADDPIAEVKAARVEQIELPASAEGHPTGVSDVAAHLLREAFWFEQASAFKADGDRAASVPQASQPAVPEVDSEPGMPDRTGSTVAADLPEGDPESCPQSRWLAAICLLALVALVVVLTGRHPRRFGGR